MSHLKDVKVKATTLDPNAVVINLKLEKHKLSNVLVDGRLRVNFMSNHLQKQLDLPPPTNAKFILRMA